MPSGARSISGHRRGCCRSTGGGSPAPSATTAGRYGSPTPPSASMAGCRARRSSPRPGRRSGRVHHHLAQGGRSQRAPLRQPAGMAAPRHSLGGCRHGSASQKATLCGRISPIGCVYVLCDFEGQRMCLVLFLGRCLAVLRLCGVISCNSRLGRSKFPFRPLREFARKGLICLIVFADQTAVLWGEVKYSRFDGKNPEPSRHLQLMRRAGPGFARIPRPHRRACRRLLRRERSTRLTCHA